MPPKRNAVRRQREDPSSSNSQPHHVMTQPVFIQKFLPFAVSSHLSGSTFKSVSSSWLETQVFYSGQSLCWSAFYQSSHENRKKIKKIIHGGYSSLDLRNIDVRAKYLPLLEQIYEACEVMPIDSVKDLISSIDSHVSCRTPLMKAIRYSHLRGVEILLNVIRSRCGEKYLKAHLELMNDEDCTPFLISCKYYQTNDVCCDESRLVCCKILDTLKSFNDVDFLKKQIRAKSVLGSLLQVACLPSGRSLLVKTLFDTIRHFDEEGRFMREILSEPAGTYSRCVMDTAVDSDRETFMVILGEMKKLDHSFYPGFLKNYFVKSSSKGRFPPLINACIYQQTWCVEEILKAIRDISESEAKTAKNGDISPLAFLKEQLDKTPMHLICTSILSACCQNYLVDGEGLKIVCSYLAEVGLLIKQYDALSKMTQGKFIRYEIDVMSFIGKSYEC